MRKRKKHLSEIDKIIQHHTVMAMGAGLIPFAGVDMVAVGVLQHEMLKRMCNLYGKSYEDMQAQAYICSISGSATAKVGASFFKTIPIVGSALGGVSMSITAGASTYALGKMFVKYFEGQEIINFDEWKILFDHYKKKFIASFKINTKLANGLKSLKRLNNLRKKGDISEELFQSVKEDVLEDLKDIEVSMDKAITVVKQLADLRDEGILTEDEFQSVKDDIFDSV